MYVCLFACMYVSNTMNYFDNKVLNNAINKQQSNYIIHDTEIKPRFQVLRVSNKHSFTFFSLIAIDVRFCLPIYCFVSN